MRTVVAVGVFDGLHLAHEFIFKKVIEISCRLNAFPYVLVFPVHPNNMLGNGFKNIFMPREKLFIFNKFFPEIKVFFLGRHVLAKTAAQFLAYVRKTFSPVCWVQGYDFHFGRDKKSVKFLIDSGERVEILPPVVYGETEVRSENIRRLIREGKIEEANTLLKTPFFLSGIPVKGSGIAQRLGFPTFNLLIHPWKVLPAFGVYSALLFCNNKLYPAAVYIGTSPTFLKRSFPIAEVHVLENLSLKESSVLRVFLLSFIREEKTFENQRALVRQIHTDLMEVKRSIILSRCSFPL